MSQDQDNGIVSSDDALVDSVTTHVQNLIDSHGIKYTMKVLAHQQGYAECPPTIQEFLDDPYYLGDSLGPDVYPVWRSLLYTVYPNPIYSPYLDVVLTGSIGQGKSTVSLAGTAYDTCRMLMRARPHRDFGLGKSTRLIVALMNATKGLASNVLLDQLDQWFDNSPFFSQQIKRAQAVDAPTKFPNRINIVIGSRPSDVLGQAVFGAIMSEINFQNKVAGQAVDNYNGVRTRLKSRFMVGGSFPGRMWIDSSKTDSGSFIEDYLLKGREDDPTTIVHDRAIWDVLPQWKTRYCGKKFKVFAGNQFKDPFILEKPSDIIGLDEAHIIDVPVEYEQEFRTDIYRSLQDLAGKSTQAVHKFIPSAERIEESMRRENPVSKEVIVTDFYDSSEKFIDYIDYSKINTDQRPRFIHIDLGIVNDKTGIACTRLDGVIELERSDPFTGKTVKVTEPIYTTEFVLCVQARVGQQMPIYKVKELVINLRQRNFPIAVVSTDGYQSTNLRQDLEFEGFDTQLISVDRTLDPYNDLKISILEGRWNGVAHPILNKELKQLEIKNQKVDHPDRGSKDIADAVAGSLHSAKKNMQRYRANTTTSEMIQALESLSKPANAYEQVFSMRR